METAVWWDWRKPPAALPQVDRIYFGHETCQELLPPPDVAERICRLATDVGLAVTLVVPFLTDMRFDGVMRLVERLSVLAGGFEVVSSDWGLLAELGSRRLADLSVGRLLTAQHGDSRIARITSPPAAAPRYAVHLDGALVEVEPRAATPTLVEHYRSCWIDRPDVIELLQQWGISRAEMSNTIQGVSLQGSLGWSYSLHVDDVLVTVARWCDALAQVPRGESACAACQSVEQRWQWHTAAGPLALVRLDNALFGCGGPRPENLGDLPVDRLVKRRTAEPGG